MRRFAHAMLLVASFCLMGGHWAVLQTAGWIGMAVSYSLEQKSLQSGLDATFSGEKPCGLCTIVSNGKEHENDSPATVLNVKKLEATLSQRLIPAKRQYDAELRYSLQAERMPRSVALDLPAPVPIVQALA